MLTQQRQRDRVDRHAVPFDRSRGLHEPATQQRARQIDAGQHRQQYAPQQQHVGFAIAQDLGPFLGRPRRAAQDGGNHAFLGGALDRVDAKIGCGRNQAGAMVPAVGAGAELGEGVENVFWLRPAQRPEDSPFRRTNNAQRSAYRRRCGNGGCDPNSSCPSRQTLPLNSSCATMQTGRGRSPDRLASAGVAWPPKWNSESTSRRT